MKNNQLVASVLAAMMVVGSVPAPAWAAETPTPTAETQDGSTQTPISSENETSVEIGSEEETEAPKALSEEEDEAEEAADTKEGQSVPAPPAPSSVQTPNTSDQSLIPGSWDDVKNAAEPESYTELNLSGLELGNVTSNDLTSVLTKFKNVKTLNISDTGITEIFDDFPLLKQLTTLTASDLYLTSLAGLETAAHSSGFIANGKTWNLSGSKYSAESSEETTVKEQIANIEKVFTEESGGKFTAPTVAEDVETYLNAARSWLTKLKADLGTDGGRAKLEWDTIISASHFYKSAVLEDEHNKLTDAQKQTLDELTKDFASITELDMSGKDVNSSDKGYDISTGALTPFTGLKKLNLSNVKIKGESGGLVGLTQMEELDLSGNPELDATHLGALMYMSKLKKLNLANTGVGDFGGLTNTKVPASLEELDISGSKVTKIESIWNGPDQDTAFPNLKTFTAKGLELESISGLVEIAMAGGEEGEDGYTFNPKLKDYVWDLSGSTLTSTAKNVEHVQRLTEAFKDHKDDFKAPDIEKANLDMAVQLAEDSFNKVKTALSSDAGKAKLTWDDLIDALHWYNEAKTLDGAGTNEKLKAVTDGYAAITELDMSGKDASKYTLSKGLLTPLTGLTKLNMSETGIVDASSLAGLTSLETIDLSNNPITEDSFGAFAGMGNLKELDLAGTQVKDFGGLVGAGVSNTLETLDISDTKISKIESIWNAGENAFPHLTTLTAKGLSLVSISGLVEVVSAEGANLSDIIQWDLGGSKLSDDAKGTNRAHVDKIKEKLSNKFTPPEVAFRVTFELGNDEIAEALYAESGAVLTSKPATPVWAGHEFIGWFTTQDGETAFDFTKPVTADTTVYAHWKTATYTVTLKLNGGTLSGSGFTQDGNVWTKTGKYEDKVTLPASATREDTTGTGTWNFEGWYAVASCTGSKHSEIEVLKDVTYYAGWSFEPADSTSGADVPSTGISATTTVENPAAGVSDATKEAAESVVAAVENKIDKDEAEKKIENAIKDKKDETREKLRGVVVKTDTSATIDQFAKRNIFYYVDTNIKVQAKSDTTTGGNDIPTEMTFDITPVSRVVASIANQPSSVKIGENAVVVEDTEETLIIEEPVVISLEVPAGFVQSDANGTANAYVKHSKVGGKTYEYTAKVAPVSDATQSSTISFTNPHGFSEFTISTTSNEKVVAKATYQDVEVGYFNLQDAVDEVKAGSIEVTKADQKAAIKDIGKDDVLQIQYNTGNKPNISTSSENVAIDDKTDGVITITYKAGSKPTHSNPPAPPTNSDNNGGGGGGGGGGSSSGNKGGSSTSSSNSNAPKIVSKTDKDGNVTKTATYSDGSVIARKNAKSGDITITLTNKKKEVLANVSIPATTASSATFSDVQNADWFANSVSRVTALGMFKGVSDTEFGPDIETTRSMFVTVLYRLCGEVSYGLDKRTFSDVPDEQWFANAVAWAAAMGVTTGTDKGFEPDASITRQDLVTMLYRFSVNTMRMEDEKADLSRFSDASTISSYANSAMQWAVANGLINGRDTGLEPLATATRAELATILVRYVDLLAQRDLVA